MIRKRTPAVYRISLYESAVKMVSASHIPDLETSISRMVKNKNIDEALYNRYIRDYFDFDIVKKDPLIKSLIIIATPSPALKVRFNFKNDAYWVNIPPTYTDKKMVNSRIRDITTRLFEGNGYNTIPVILPKKLVAVHSGLARFGKNNLCYVPGMGSYIRLTLFGTDLPCDEDSWGKLQMLERCANCKACIKVCTTGSITENNFIIKAERCLTYFNERTDDFPGWIDSSWHNSLIGCMQCQNICPENKNVKGKFIADMEFTEPEIRLLIDNTPFNELPDSFVMKFKSLCLDHYYQQICRNMQFLI